VSGRRVYSRFMLHSPAGGMRVSRDVELLIEQSSPALSEVFVLSDAPAVPGELLTLALVSRTKEMECRVKVADSRPHVAAGVMRHLVRLEILTALPATGSFTTELESD
jgi:hypothetical protein